MKLRPFQSTALSLLKNPIHLVCVAPTGSGKSLVFREFLRRTRKRALIIFPLIALARQQVQKLRQDQIDTFWPHDGPLKDSSAQVWALSPEHLFCGTQKRPRWNALEIFRPEILIVDEAHCVWEWGRAFRPEFSRIPELLQLKSIQRSLWLTATLPIAARESLFHALPRSTHILDSSRLPEKLTVKSQKLSYFARKNYLIEHIQTHPQAGIVFVSRRRDTLELCKTIEALGRQVIVYHGGLARDERLAIEHRISKEKEAVVIATSAFGMGMDFLHFRWVLLWQPSLTLLALTQAIGRVGRAEQEGEATILWDESDFLYFKNWLKGDAESIHQLWEVKALLEHSLKSPKQLKDALTSCLHFPERPLGHPADHL